MQAKLTVVGGKANKREVTIQVPATIGRSRDADLTVGHRMISRKHCETYLADGLVMIRDVGSLNGTYVHGRRIREAPLPPGEKFSIGPVTFQISYQYSGDPSTLPPIVPAEAAPADAAPAKPPEDAPAKPAEAVPARKGDHADVYAIAEPAAQPANSRPKEARTPKPASPPAAQAKPEPSPAKDDAGEEPDFQLVEVDDDDFELADEALGVKKDKKEPSKKKPAAAAPQGQKDPEDQLLDDFLNDLQ